MCDEKQTAMVEKKGEALTFGGGAESKPMSLVIGNVNELYMIAKMVVSSGLAPKGMDTSQAAIAIAKGMEVGAPPMFSISNIAIINNRACMWGDILVGVVEASGKLEYLKEEPWDTSAQNAIVRIKRYGKPEHIEQFSMADAKRAGLDTKETYKKYPQRMCGWKAKTYALRSQFADVLGGLTTREEVEDYGVIDGSAEVIPSPAATLTAALVAEPGPSPSGPWTIGVEPAPPAEPSLTDQAKERLNLLDDMGLYDEAEAVLAELDCEI